jgi:hypothetical protein
MSLSPKEQDDKRPKDGFAAAEIARANLSYDPPSTGQPWRKITRWGGLLFLALAVVLVACRLFH